MSRTDPHPSPLPREREHGFTLLELIVVLVIGVILYALILAAMLSVYDLPI